MSRKLDIALAEALGYEALEKTFTIEDFSGKYWVYKKNVESHGVPLPTYSSDGNAMLELDREMTERGYSFFLDRYFIRPPWDRNEVIYGAAYYPAKLIKTDKMKQYAKTEPLARARAAYYALTGKGWQNDPMPVF